MRRIVAVLLAASCLGAAHLDGLDKAILTGVAKLEAGRAKDKPDHERRAWVRDALWYRSEGPLTDDDKAFVVDLADKACKPFDRPRTPPKTKSEAAWFDCYLDVRGYRYRVKLWGVKGEDGLIQWEWASQSPEVQALQYGMGPQSSFSPAPYVLPGVAGLNCGPVG